MSVGRQVKRQSFVMQQLRGSFTRGESVRRSSTGQRRRRKHVQRFKDGNLAESVVAKPSLYASFAVKSLTKKMPLEGAISNKSLSTNRTLGELDKLDDEKCNFDASDYSDSQTPFDDVSTPKGESSTYPPTLSSLRKWP